MCAACRERIIHFPVRGLKSVRPVESAIFIEYESDDCQAQSHNIIIVDGGSPPVKLVALEAFAPIQANSAFAAPPSKNLFSPAALIDRQRQVFESMRGCPLPQPGGYFMTKRVACSP